VERLRKNIPDLLYLGLIVGAFIFVGQRIFGTSPTSGWKTDFENASLDLNAVLSGGVPRDGIPPIDNPFFIGVSEVNDLQPQSPVISININGDARAYPLEVLTRHEIANDVVGDVPVAVTFCPLCNSAIVYERTVDDNVLRFGVSGNLYNSDLIMWDDLTESWWQQLTGKGVVGEYNGYQLEIVPSQVIGYGVFKDHYPDGKVLRGPQGIYGRNPYAGYDSSPNPFLFRGPMDERLFPTARVLAIDMNGLRVAYSFNTLQTEHLVNDTVEATDVVVFWQTGAASALDNSDIDSSKDVGMAIMYHRTLSSGETLTFRFEDGVFRDNETDSTWNIFGEATDGELEGSVLRQLNAFPHFWFAWAAFYPDTVLYESSS
jgi:hypothetical protein